MSWWLSIEGVSGEGDEIKEGMERHSRIERGLEIIKKEEESSEEAEKGLHSFTLIAILLASIGILIVYFGYYGTARSANLAAIFILVMVSIFQPSIPKTLTSDFIGMIVLTIAVLLYGAGLWWLLRVLNTDV